MVIGIVIPADEDEPIYKQEFKSLSDYQQAVGGLIEAIDLDSPPATIYVNEEGKLQGLPLNRRATMISWMHNSSFRGKDVIKGDAVLVGPPDDEGKTLAVPQAYVFLLFETATYRIEVQTADDPAAWNGNQARYDNWVEAYNAGLGLWERWLAVENVRVIAA